nr:immunoglobulin heavy chain junction region [Macaca mulatta]
CARTKGDIYGRPSSLDVW